MYGTITAKDGLKLRKSYNVKAVALDLMPFGDRVEIMHQVIEAPGWAFVAWLPARGARLQGYADTKYIQLDQPKPAPQLIPEPETSMGYGLLWIALGVGIATVLIYAGFR